MGRRTSVLLSPVRYLMSWHWWEREGAAHHCHLGAACLHQGLALLGKCHRGAWGSRSVPSVPWVMVVIELCVRVGVSSVHGYRSPRQPPPFGAGWGSGHRGAPGTVPQPEQKPLAWGGASQSLPRPWGLEVSFQLSLSALPSHPCWHWKQLSPAALIHTPLLQTEHTERGNVTPLGTTNPGKQLFFFFFTVFKYIPEFFFFFKLCSQWMQLG